MAKRKKSSAGKRRATRKNPAKRAAPKARRSSPRKRTSARRRRVSNPTAGLPAMLVNPSELRASNPKRKRRTATKKRKNPARRRVTRRNNPGGLSVTGILIGSGLLAAGAVTAVLGGKALEKYGPVMDPKTTAAVQGAAGIAGGIAAAYFGGGYGASFGGGFAAGSLQPAAVMIANAIVPPAAPATAPAAMAGLGRLRLIDDPNIRGRKDLQAMRDYARLVPFRASMDGWNRDSVTKDTVTKGAGFM